MGLGSRVGGHVRSIIPSIVRNHNVVGRTSRRGFVDGRTSLILFQELADLALDLPVPRNQFISMESSQHVNEKLFITRAPLHVIQSLKIADDVECMFALV